MSELQIKPDQLNRLAEGIQSAERKADDAVDGLRWNFNSLMMGMTGARTGKMEDLQFELESEINKYKKKLDEIQAGVKLTQGEMEAADRKLADHVSNVGLEILGWYDIQRIYKEYDPVTGKALSGWDRALAGGLLLLTVFPPAKLVGLGIKGAVMGTKTIIRFGDDAVQLFKKVYNALDPTIVKNMIHATYQQVVKGPLVDTANYLKKIRREIGNIHLPTGMGWVPAGAADGIHSYTVRDAVEGAKDTLVMAGGRAKGFVDEAFGKGIDKTVKPNDVVPYRPSNSPLENHHGVMDVWAKHNVPNYVSRGGNTPTVALTKEQHDATKAVYRQWLYEKTGKKVGGKIDWQSVSPREIQELTERMFAAANVPISARKEYYNSFNKYNFRE